MIGCAVPSSRDVGGAVVVEASSWPVVEFVGDLVQVALGPPAQIGAFREVLAEQTVGVLVGATLPRRVWVSEVDPEAGGLLDPLVVEHLVALVPGQGPA